MPVLSSRKLIGRELELHVLVDARRALSSGRGTVVLVGGEAGIGKTRLLKAFKAGISGGRAPHYAAGECLADAPRPYGPFRAVLAALSALAPSVVAGSSTMSKRAVAALVPDAVVPDAVVPDAIAPQPGVLEKADLFAGVLECLQTVAAKRATIVVLEDLHWADAATLELLAYLAPRIGSTRLLILATYRDDEVRSGDPLYGTLARLTRERTVRHVLLEPLGEGDVRALIREALGNAHALDTAQVRDVVARAEGNPFFVEELLKKALTGERSAVPAALPISIRAMLLERLAALNNDERAVLDHAAVLAQDVDVDLLALVMQRDVRDLDRILRHLTELNFFIRDRSRTTRFAFRHALTRQVVYDDLLPVDTRALHEHIVRSLEALAERARPVDAMAYHAWKSGLAEETLRYSERAGDAALGVHAAAQAAAYFERALEHARDDETRIRLLGKAGDAYVQASVFASAAAACVRQHALLVANGRLDEAARPLTRAAGEFANDGRLAQAYAVIDDFLRAYGERLADAAHDHVQASLARIATACDDFGRAKAALGTLRSPERLTGLTHQVFWLARLFVAEHDVALAPWREAAAALRRGNAETYPLMGAQMLHSIAATALTFGETAEAERAIDDALALDREFGFARAQACANAVKACILAVRGRLDEARTCIEAAFVHADMFVVRLEVALGATPAPIALGDEALAERCVDDEAATLVRRAGMESALTAFTAMRSARLFAQGRVREAEPLLGEALRGPQHAFAVVHAWPLAARHAGAADLERIAALCAKRAGNPDDRVAQACATLLDAALARLKRAPGHRQLADAAAGRYRALGWPLHEAQALELAGDVDTALARYRSCGSIADVRRVERSVQKEPAAPAARGTLSPREREVAAFVAQGLTNRAIADVLGVGEKTVEKYLSATYAKLGFSTRAQLAAHVERAKGTA